jgi:hypothetical protein
VFGLSACGHFGIDLGDGDTVSGTGGGPSPHSGGADTGSGGKVATSGGRTTGGDAASGGAGTGSTGSGAASSGGGSSSGGGGGAVDGGASNGSGGASNGSGGASNGSGGTAGDCNLSDPVCAGLVQAMVNRYPFDGAGTEVIDSLGGDAGLVHGTTLDGSGELTLSGAGDYVELPAGLISSLPNATFEVWFVWHGGESWQKLFEFGDQDASSSPVNYLFATPEAGGSKPEINALGAGLRHLGGGERQLRTSEFSETGVLTQVVLIADDSSNRLTLYKNGQWLADLDTEVRLDGIQDNVNSLGKSLFSDDPTFDGELLDFRIYGEALPAAMVEKSYELGSDATFPPAN